MVARPGETEHGSAEPSGDPRPAAGAPPAPALPPWPPPPAPPQAPWLNPPRDASPHASASASGWSGSELPEIQRGELEPARVPPASRHAAAFWLLMGLVGFAIGQLVGTVFVAIAAAAAGESGEVSRFATMSAPPEWYVGTSLVGLWVGFFVGPWIASKAWGTGRFLKDLGVRFRPVDLVGILIGLGSQILIDALYAPFITHLKNFTAPTHKLVGASHGWGFIVIALLTVCGAPFFEEVLFRGLAFKALARLFTPLRAGASRRRAVGITAAVVVDGLVFGLAHWELYQFAGLAAFGMVLAFVSYKTGRLGMNMVAHATFNLVAVLALASTSGGVH